MRDEDDRTYFLGRAQDEREAAARSSCIVKDVHLEAADLYIALASKLSDITEDAT